ncbi:MAG: type VII toxin-antitoxin system MntA family adenylyltransferase antitoxin [Gammaproteobacteria bacterium]
MKQPGNTTFTQLAQAIRQQVADVQAIYAFSSYANGMQRPDSDIDLAVLASTPLDAERVFMLSGTLTDIAQRNVDVVNLHSAAIVLRSQVIANGRRIYCGDQTACESFEDLAYSSYARLNEERRDTLADIQVRGPIHG